MENQINKENQSGLNSDQNNPEGFQNKNIPDEQRGEENNATDATKKDPSTWPSGDKSLEQLMEEDESMKETRIGGGNATSGGAGTTGNS